jgi:hypothetical protein
VSLKTSLSPVATILVAVADGHQKSLKYRKVWCKGCKYSWIIRIFANKNENLEETVRLRFMIVQIIIASILVVLGIIVVVLANTWAMKK